MSNEDSNQPAHQRAVDQFSLSSYRNFESLAIQKMPSEDSDQTVRMADLNHHWAHTSRIHRDACIMLIPLNPTFI